VPRVNVMKYYVINTVS